MKALHLMNNVEKAKLLHELCPESIPVIIGFMQGMNKVVKKGNPDLESKWDNPIISYGYWVRLSQENEKIINQYGSRLYKSSKLFSDQLFDGMLALWAGDMVLKFGKLKECDHKTKQAIDLLFG